MRRRATISGITPLDALFTSTSAVCVTGLIVMDTAVDFNFFGKTVLLLLIQLGGFGIMTFSLGLVSLLGKNISLRWDYTLKGIYSESGSVPVKKILIRVIKYTFILESFSALLLFFRFIHYFPLTEALGHAVFHAVSAFCNAGFSTFSDSLIYFKKDFYVLSVVSLTIILGGTGFITLTEISSLRHVVFSGGNRRANPRQIQLGAVKQKKSPSVGNFFRELRKITFTMPLIACICP